MRQRASKLALSKALNSYSTQRKKPKSLIKEQTSADKSKEYIINSKYSRSKLNQQGLLDHQSYLG